MSKNFKITPFARFFIAMLFIAPLAYLGASYMNGQDGFQNIKNSLNGQKTEVVQNSESTSNSTSTYNSEEITAQLEKLQEDLSYKNQRIEDLLKENEMLKEKNAALERQATGQEDTQ